MQSMKQTLRTALEQPFYPWLVGIYPILHLYLENFGLVRDGEFPPTIVAMILGTTLVYAVAGPVIRDPHKRAFYLSLLSLYFSLSGHVYVMIFMPESLLFWNVATAAGLILLIKALHSLLPPQSYALALRPVQSDHSRDAGDPDHHAREPNGHGAELRPGQHCL